MFELMLSNERIPHYGSSGKMRIRGDDDKKKKNRQS